MLLSEEEEAGESRGPSNKKVLIRESGVWVFKGMCTVYKSVIEVVHIWL